MAHKQHHPDFRAIILGGMLVLLVGVYFIGRSIWFFYNQKNEALKKSELQETKDVPLISPVTLREKIRNEEPFTLIDIRSREAYNIEHIPQAFSVPGGNLSSFTPKDESVNVVIIYSEEDKATLAVAKETLRKKKFPYFFLEGGFENWKSGSNQTLSSGDPTSFIDQSKVTFISAAELKTLLENSDAHVFLLDVQSESNFQKKHIRGAKNIPLEELEERAKEIPAGREVVVYGSNELASFQGGVRLFDLNVFATKTLDGNANLTTASGLPLEP